MSLTVLSDRQREDLNNSVLNYLTKFTDKETISKLQKDLNINEIHEDNDLLIKKWNIIMRLQKKINELESQLKHQDSNKNINLFESNELNKLNWLPSKVKKTLNHDSIVTSIAIHPNLPQLITATQSGQILIWNLMDLTQPTKVIQAHNKSINKILISSNPIKFDDSNNCFVLITCSSDLFIKIWDLRTFKLIRNLSGHEHIISSIILNDDKMYSCSRDNSIKLWNIKNGWCLKTFIGHSDWVRSIDLINNEFVLSGSNDQSVRLSHGESGTGLGLMIGHEKVVEIVKFIPMISNKYLNKLSAQYSIENSIDENKIYDQLGFKYCVSGGRDDLINIWKLPIPIIRPHNHPVPSSNPQGTLITSLRGHKSWIKDLIFHPNGKILVSCSDDKAIKFWNLETGECLKTISDAHDGFLNCLEWAPSIFELNSNKNDEKIINDSMRCIFVSGGNDQTAKVWE